MYNSIIVEARDKVKELKNSYVNAQDFESAAYVREFERDLDRILSNELKLDNFLSYVEQMGGYYRCREKVIPLLSKLQRRTKIIQIEENMK